MTVMNGRQRNAMNAQTCGKYERLECTSRQFRSRTYEISGRLIFVGKGVSRIIFVGKPVTSKTEKQMGR
jgi:hypothetical protein